MDDKPVRCSTSMGSTGKSIKLRYLKYMKSKKDNSQVGNKGSDYFVQGDKVNLSRPQTGQIGKNNGIFQNDFLKQ